MKIYIPQKSKKTGKDYFFDRLSLALVSLGEKVTHDPHSAHDISLQAVFIEKTRTKKYVLRLNGVHHDIHKNYRKINQSIVVKGLSHANGVVYQSQFSQDMCDKYLGEFSGPHAIIPNGAPVCKSKAKGKHFVAASRWRPHKRLQDIIRSFLAADLDKYIKLYIAGSLDQCGILPQKLALYQRLPNIIFLGEKCQLDLLYRLNHAYAAIHLCWFDNCPNSVVEAIAAGVPVITNNVGGTHEIVRPSGGMVLDLDKPYDLEPCELYKPPAVDHDLVGWAIKSLTEETRHIYSKHVDIMTVAKKYRKFFLGVLNG